MNRVHRIGQDKPVLIQRLIVEESVETTIMKLQVRASHADNRPRLKVAPRRKNLRSLILHWLSLVVQCKPTN